MSNLGPEERAAMLRLLAVAPRDNPPDSRAVDWDALARYAGIDMGQLLAHGAARHAAGVPAPVLQMWRTQQAAIAIVHLRRQAALRDSLGTLAGAGIPVIVLKGAVLAHLDYASPLLRSMSDLDLWVPAQRLEEALSLLAASGLVPFDESHVVSRVAPDVMIAVELHGELQSLQDLSWSSFEHAWEKTERASLGGIDAQVLRSEPMLIHLCLHLGRAHAFVSRLRALVDIALVVQRRHAQWDWPRMMEDWERERITSWMLLGVTLARDLLGAPVPADLEASVVDAQTWRAMRTLAEEQIWEARSYRLPPALGLIVSMPAGVDRLRWLRRRFLDRYWEAPHELWRDLSEKVPAYFGAWRQGVLRGPRLSRALGLEHSRRELERLVRERGDLGYAPPPAAATPGNTARPIAAGSNQR